MAGQSGGTRLREELRGSLLLRCNGWKCSRQSEQQVQRPCGGKACCHQRIEGAVRLESSRQEEHSIK